MVRAREIILDVLAAELDGGRVHGPLLYPCDCTHPRHQHAGAAGAGKCQADGGCRCRRYKYDVAHDLAYRALERQDVPVIRTITEHEAHLRAEARKHRAPREDGQWGVSASDVTNCRRKIWFREIGRHQDGFVPDWEDKREAMAGTAIHKLAQDASAWAHPWREQEQTVHLAGLDADLRYDEYDPLICEVIDYKSAGQWRWDQLADGPDERTWWQLMLYALALNRAGKPVWSVRLIYIRRENGHEEPFVRPYDEDVALEALEYLIDIASALDAVKDGVDAKVLDRVLPRDRSGPGLDPLCSRCFARTACWGLDNAERIAAGRSPQSWIYLGPDPADKDVEGLLAEYDRQRAIESTGRDGKKVALALLGGIPHRTYGEWVYGEQVSRVDDKAGYYRELEETHDMPDGIRPPLGSIVMRKVERVSVAIKRVRAATTERRRGRKPAAAVTARAKAIGAGDPKAIEGVVVDHPGDAA